MPGLRGRPRRLRVGASLTAAAIVATAGCGASGHPTARPDSSTSTPPTTAVAAPAPYRWTQESSTTLAVGGGAATTLADVLAPATAAASTPASSWQIAGTTAAADGATSATVWSSPDALNWTATPLPSTAPDSQARAATTWGGRTIVVGSTGTGAAERAAAWLSPAPGQPFQQITADTAFAPPAPASGPSGGAQIDVVAAGGLGVFAAGRVAGVQAVWYSTDARHWTRLKQAESIVDAADQPQINALAVGANGVFAAGSVTDGAATDAAVWSSADGITWAAEEAPSAFTGGGDHTISSLVSLGTGFVAAGAERAGQLWTPASWISPNGRSWSQASLAFPLPTGPRADATGTQVHGLASTTTSPAAATTATGSLAAVGGSDTEQRLWTSTDGTSWTSTALPATAASAADWTAARVATDGATTIVVDDTAGAPRVLVDHAGAWTEVSANPAEFGAPRSSVTPVRLLASGSTTVLVARVDQPGQALGTEDVSSMVFTSTDGTTWKPASDTAFAGHLVNDAAAVSGGLIAVGGGAALTSTLAAGPPPAAAWTSPDGAAWTASPVSAAVFGGGAAGPDQATAITRLGQTVVAAGTASTSPAGPADQAVAWTTTDGNTWSAPVTLDGQATLGIERPAGVCAGPQTVAAVGSGTTSGPGTVALAWSSSDGVHWQAGTVTPAPDPAARESMTRCITAGNGFIAFGASQGSQGTDDPAIWYSDAGTQWTRQTVAAFTDSDLGPISDLAVSGTTWLAVGGSGTLTTAPGGALGLWRTTDAGSTWQRLDTSSAPWAAQQSASVDRVLLDGTTALVAGTVDGRLTVWQGTPSLPSGAQTVAPTSKAAHIRA